MSNLDERLDAAPTSGDQSGETLRAPLLLHSLAEFRTLLLPCLEIAGAKRVVEVGGEDGTLTGELVEWADDRNGSVICIDPSPGRPLLELDEHSSTLELVHELSVPALGDIEADAYLLDGDHNYFTVSHELDLIRAATERSGRPMLVFLHDVGWPWARRDLYYDPAALPPAEVHEHVWDRGVTRWSSETIAGGFRGGGSFAVACEEGGPRNGVLTAVEDFLAQRSDVRFAFVPCIFGFGVLYDVSAPFADEIAEALRPFDGNPLLRRLEENRLDLYLKVLELQDRLVEVEPFIGRHHALEIELAACLAGTDAVRAELAEARLHERDVRVENRALWARVEELEREVDAARRQHADLLATVESIPGYGMLRRVRRAWLRARPAVARRR